MININATVDRDLIAVAQGSLDIDFVVNKHFNELFDHYLNSGEMPYGVAKARTGDPYNWLADRLEQELGL